MNYEDFKKFAEEHNIIITEEEGEMGCGYACTYIYYEPESVIKAWNTRKEK